MVETGYRQLIVLRHAKTEQDASSDRVRELTDRGRRDAAAAGRWLAEQDLAPDVVLTSPAARALSTALLVCDQLGTDPDVQVVEDLYGASVGEALDIVTGVDSDVRRVLLVGHNPTMEDLAHELQTDVSGLWADHLPTAGIAVLDLTEQWAELGLRSAVLADWYVPRG